MTRKGFVSALLLILSLQLPGQLLHAQCPPEGCPRPPIPQQAPRHPAPRAEAEERPAGVGLTVVRILHVTPKGDGIGGSGTCIGFDASSGSTLILSCAHLFPDGKNGAGSITVYFSSGASAPAAILACNSRQDVSVIYVSSVSPKPIVTRVAKDEPRVGERLWKCGYPVGKYSMKTGPVVERFRGAFSLGHQFYAQIDFRPGDSGGGVFNAQGELVGVVHGYFTMSPEIGIAASLASIKPILAEVCWPECLKPRPPPGQKPQPPVPQPQPQPQPPVPVPQPPVDPPTPQPQPQPVPPVKPDPDVIGKLDELRKQIIDRLDKADTIADKLKVGLDKLRDSGIVQGDRLDKAAERLDKADTIIGAIRDTLKGLTEQGVGASAWAGWLPAIAAGSVTGGLGVPAYLLFLGGRFLFRRGASKFRESAPEVRERVVIRETPPPPQVVRDEHTYVPYEKPNGELAAIKDAMDEVVKKYPGAVSTVETIKSYAAQLHSAAK